MPNVNIIVGNDGSNSLQGTAGADLIYGFDPNGPQSQASSITAERVATNLPQALFAAAPPGDLSRLFVVEKTGQIKIIDLSSDQVQAAPFLDVSSQILTDGERGLLGLAFDPNFATNGFFYVDLINTSGNTEIRRYHVSSNPNIADPASATPIITIDQAIFSNHKGGWIGFGPDGDLYASLGDGGSGGDPLGSGQDINSLLGKILRIDVHADSFPGDPSRNYAVPADNPFVGMPGADEIFALACATRGGRASTARWAIFTLPMSARTNGKRSTSARSVPTTVGIVFEGPAEYPAEARSSARPSRRSIPMTTPSGIRSPAVMSIAAKGKRCRGSISSPTSSTTRSSPCVSTAPRGPPPSEPLRSCPISAR